MPSFKRISSLILNRRFSFTFVALAVVAAKGVHIHNHRSSVAPKPMLTFFFSFFTQDILLLVTVRLLLSHWVPASGKLRTLVTSLATSVLVWNASLCITSVSFYIVAGSEIHWRNIGFMADPTGRAIILSGLTVFLFVLCLCACLSSIPILQTAWYTLFGWGADIFNLPLALIWNKLHCFGRQITYSELSQQDSHTHWRDSDSRSSYDDDLDNKKDEDFRSPSISPLNSPRGLRSSSPAQRSSRRRFLSILPHLVVSILLIALFILTFIRPKDPSLIFLSWTTGLLPFVDFASSSPLLDSLPPIFEKGKEIQHRWDNHTALIQPIPLDWLPKNTPIKGFEDWHLDNPHYSSEADPFKVSNLETPLRESLRGQLKDVNIRHVVLFLLESTRHDVFPIKKNGLIWDRFAETFPDKKLPQEVQEKFANLTPTARFLTGDYEDGFTHTEQPKRRGGIHFANARTGGAYTLKSLTSTICGISPLVADFNLEHNHHFYQPCLPHIFEAMNRAENTSTKKTKSKRHNDKWNSYFFQAAKLDFDNHFDLMAAMGFPKPNIIGGEYLKSQDARHGAVTLPLINGFAFEEDPLEYYITDAFEEAAKENSRVFLSHITSTSHHQFNLPKNETYTPLGKNDGLDMMSHYINTIGYDDRWIRKVLDILDKQGVANETLVIFQGDHGISLPENDIASPYYNPNMGVEHVPLVISHPQLPAFSVEEAVHATQVLPTILDILLETGSLDETSRQAAKDLIRNYEGQSLIRPLNTTAGQSQWQFTITNPGRAMLTVRDVQHPERHLVVPVIENVDWRLTMDIAKDPREQNSLQAMDFKTFLQSVDEKYGRDAAEWVEEGAFVARWFVKENSKRWRFDL